jgi:hypothetical protein
MERFFMAAASLAAVGVASYYWRSRTGIPDKHTTAPNTGKLNCPRGNGELKCPVEGVSLRVIRHMVAKVEELAQWEGPQTTGMVMTRFVKPVSRSQAQNTLIHMIFLSLK